MNSIHVATKCIPVKTGLDSLRYINCKAVNKKV